MGVIDPTAGQVAFTTALVAQGAAEGFDPSRPQFDAAGNFIGYKPLPVAPTGFFGSGFPTGGLANLTPTFGPNIPTGFGALNLSSAPTQGAVGFGRQSSGRIAAMARRVASGAPTIAPIPSAPNLAGNPPLPFVPLPTGPLFGPGGASQTGPFIPVIASQLPPTPTSTQGKQTMGLFSSLGGVVGGVAQAVGSAVGGIIAPVTQVLAQAGVNALAGAVGGGSSGGPAPAGQAPQMWATTTGLVNASPASFQQAGSFQMGPFAQQFGGGGGQFGGGSVVVIPPGGTIPNGQGQQPQQQQQGTIPMSVSQNFIPTRSSMTGAITGARAQTHIVQNPVSGAITWFKPAGRPILWSGDLQSCKRVNKIARRARRAKR